jgi:hypothetical protein
MGRPHGFGAGMKRLPASHHKRSYETKNQLQYDVLDSLSYHDLTLRPEKKKKHKAVDMMMNKVQNLCKKAMVS